MPSMTRGPLPARVYWRRRLLLLTVALLLVVGFAKLLGNGSDGSTAPDRASQVAAEARASGGPAGDSTASTTDDRTNGAGTKATSKKSKKGAKGKKKNKATPTATPLAEPDGPCADEDVAVVPEVPDPVAGSDLVVRLQLRTISAEACTWRVTPATVTLKITSGKDDVWSSRECPRVVPSQDVVLRRAETTKVDVTWNTRRSDETCSRRTAWARPGYYHVIAAALAGEPSDLQFKLEAPSAPVVTKTAKPRGDGSTKGGKKNNG